MTRIQPPNKQDFIKYMEKDLGEVFCSIYWDVYWLNERLQEYSKLFKKNNTIKLLNNSAPSFFKMIQDIMFENFILNIARLTDSPFTGNPEKGQSNLTIQRLPDLMKDQVFKKEIDNLIKEALDKSKFTKKWRHKTLAHNDLNVALEKESLQSEKLENIENAIKALIKLLDTIDGKYRKDGLSWQSHGLPGSVQALIYIIEDGLLYRKDKK